MGVEYVQSNLTAGELTPVLHARTDITKYNNGVGTATNMVILPHGGMRRRPGMSKIQDGIVGENARLAPFVFNTDQKYLIVFKSGFIDVIRDGVKVASSIVSPYTTNQVLQELDVIQSADTMIIVHEDYAPMQLQRQGSDTNWALSTISLSNIPQFNFTNYKYQNTGTSEVVDIIIGDVVWNNDGNSVKGADNTNYRALTNRTSVDISTDDFTDVLNWVEVGAGNEDVWSATRGWPRTATFHQGRLFFGGSREKINSVWGSVPNDFFNFDIGTGAADNATFDTLDTDQFNAINGIFSGRHLQLFTSGGEFYNSSKTIIPEDSSWSRQTSYGAKKEKPISVDGATLFVDSSERTIRQFVWSFNEDSYISVNASLISSHIVNDIQSMATIRGTSADISDFVYVVNGDGTVAVMNSMRHEDILGWTSWTTQGLFKDVTVVGKEVYFLVERNAEVFIEKIEEGTYTDHNVSIQGVKPTTFNVIQGFDNVIQSPDNVVWTDTSTGTAVTSITTNYKDMFVSPSFDFRVVADYSIQPDATFIVDGTDLNHVEITRDAYNLEVGLDYDVEVRTLPLNVEAQGVGAVVNLRKRVNRVILNLNESLGVYVSQNYLSDRQFTVVLDERPEPFTGVHEIYLFGYTDRLVEVSITQQNPLPFMLLNIDSEIEF